jgi:ABC-type transporter MlaC component
MARRNGLALRSLALSFLLPLFLSLFPPIAHGEDFAAAATRFVAGLGEETTRPVQPAVLGSGAVTPFRAFIAHVDLVGFSEIVLGLHWAAASSPQRQEFLGLVTALFEQSYAGFLPRYTGGRFEIVGSRPVGQAGALVASRVADATGDNLLRIDWFVRRGGDGVPRIVDVQLGSVSLARTWKEEFGSVLLASGGLDGLLQQLRARTRPRALNTAAAGD